MQLAKCFVLLVASVLAGALSSEGSSLQLRSQHSLGSSQRSEAFHRLLLAKEPTCNKEGQPCTKASDCCEKEWCPKKPFSDKQVCRNPQTP
jgi:hypothetical protein